MTLFITINYFSPAYKAGGPIRSLHNLVANMVDEPLRIFILCSNTDLDGTILNVEFNKWVKFTENTNVFYASKQKLNKKSIFSLLDEIHPNIIFINGIYSWHFTILPLLWKGLCRRIVSVRGMLHPGALSQKPLKKKLFLAVFKMFGLHKKAEFHATTLEEKGFIQVIMGNTAQVTVVPNLPGAYSNCGILHKNEGALMLTSIALISPMKNISLVLEALSSCKSNVVYDIYGPVKDEMYWGECVRFISTLPSNIKVTYKGAVEANEIGNVLDNYHAFILPSKSENFGHAIYEALSTGKPVITSYYTPWNELTVNKAGFNVDINNVATITAAIEMIASFNNDTYKEWSAKTARFAARSIDIASIKEQYKKLFNIGHTAPASININ